MINRCQNVTKLLSYDSNGRKLGFGKWPTTFVESGYHGGRFVMSCPRCGNRVRQMPLEWFLFHSGELNSILTFQCFMNRNVCLLYRLDRSFQLVMLFHEACKTNCLLGFDSV